MVDPSKISVSSAYELYQRVVTIVAKYRDDGGQVPTEVVSQLFACADLVLTAYYQRSNWMDEKTPKEAIPRELAHEIAVQIRYIRAGNLPGPIADLIRPGTPGVGPHESHDIAIAVVYMKLAEAHEIEDRAPVRTIAELFGVTRRTAGRWKNDTYSYVEPTGFFPDATSKERVRLIEDEIVSAAKRYRSGGRGAQAREDRSRQTRQK